MNRSWILFLSFCLSAGGADKSGVSPNSISIPTGPGSIEGLGESFQPVLNSGTAHYAVKLAVPPGTSGQRPSLALQYEGGSGNGILGFGWSLPTPCVQYRSDEGIPTYGARFGFAREDRFINDAREKGLGLVTSDRIECGNLRLARLGRTARP